jgi:ABC-2 type transport system ATP-binding protein
VTTSEPVLRARGVARRFGARVALEPCDVEIRAGETVALIGPNGAGKSTLLALLAGALAPTAGSVERAADVEIGWVPQRPAYYDRLTPRENLELFARLEGERAPATAAERLLARFDVPGDPIAAELSVGNRQRLNVAVGLLGSPQLLLLDEPTASLDPGQRRKLWDAVSEVRARGGSVVFATQNLEEIDDHASRVVVLQHGLVTFDGLVAEYGSADAEGAFA